MNRLTTPRLLAASTLAALFAAGIANAAIRPPQDGDRDRPQQARKDHRQEARAEGKQQAQQARQAPFRQRGEDRREAPQEPREDRRDAVQQARGERRDWQQGPQGADRRDAQQDRRDDRQDARQDRRADRSDWRRDARSDARQRIAYARYQQDYSRRMRDFHLRIAPRYYVRPAHYRYSYGGAWYTTSNYGADVLRQAVDWGYREGVRAGRVDRNDGWQPDYRDSVAWRDGGFGYGGRYVSSADYAYYFRQGFQRGYDDGYFGRMQYGRYGNNDVVIAEAVIATILGLQLLR